MTDRQILGGKRNVGWASVPSDAHPEVNEDAFFAIPDRGFYGVFDGMGGHTHGDLAARIAADEVQDVLALLASEVPTEVLADTLRDALRAADLAIRTEAVARRAREIGSTAVVAVVRPLREDEGRVVVGWAGDSRALVVPNGARRLRALTLDDGVVRLRAQTPAQARRVQSTLGAVTDARSLTFRERDLFLERNVLIQAVGTSLQAIHVVEEALTAGDHLLLTSDGIHDNLTNAEIAAFVRRAPSPRDAAGRLVLAARTRSRDAEHVRAKPDDMTAIVIRLGE